MRLATGFELVDVRSRAGHQGGRRPTGYEAAT